MTLNNEPYMDRPTLIDLNLFDVKYYSFMISLDQCSGSCNAVDGLFLENMFSRQNKRCKC